MKIIYGSELSKEMKEAMANEVKTLDRKPCLAVLLVGDNPASVSYVKGKNKACLEVGFDYRQIDLSEDVSEKEVIDVIKSLNKDDFVDGILVQLPLPKHINEQRVINSIDPGKDVDGLHPVNFGRLFAGLDAFYPCTPLGIIELLKKMEVDLEGKNVVVVGRSNLVGLPVSRLLLKQNATVTICHSRTKDLARITREADVLVAAIGKPRFFTEEYIKDGAYVIDVGVNRVDGKLCGDVDFDNVKDKCAAITPVPKGCGPMTITMLLENTMKSYRMRSGK